MHGDTRGYTITARQFQQVTNDYCPSAVHKWEKVIQASVGPLNHTVDIKGSTQCKVHIGENKSAH